MTAGADDIGKAVAKRLRFVINLFAQLIVANRHDELLITSFIMQTLQIADASDDRHAIYERPQLRTIIDEGTVILLYPCSSVTRPKPPAPTRRSFVFMNCHLIYYCQNFT